MILGAEIINQPYSGEYEERTYDNQSPWNSQDWTWIKFTNDDFYEWTGQFRGFPRQVSISYNLSCILVLTSDYLFLLDRTTADLIELEGQPQYQSLTVAPTGEFVLADYYNFYRVKITIKEKDRIESPIQMDIIEFKDWSGNKLNFTCEEFLNWGKHLEMELDCEIWEIKIKTIT